MLVPKELIRIKINCSGQLQIGDESNVSCDRVIESVVRLGIKGGNYRILISACVIAKRELFNVLRHLQETGIRPITFIITD